MITNVPFIYGRDDSLDQRIAPNGVLHTLENGKPVKGGRIGKRGPYLHSVPYSELGGYNTALVAPFNTGMVRIEQSHESGAERGDRIDGAVRRLANDTVGWVYACQSPPMLGAPFSQSLEANGIGVNVASAANDNTAIYVYTEGNNVGPYVILVYVDGVRVASYAWGTAVTHSHVRAWAFDDGTLAVGAIVSGTISYAVVTASGVAVAVSTGLSPTTTGLQVWDVCPVTDTAHPDRSAVIACADVASGDQAKIVSPTAVIGGWEADDPPITAVAVGRGIGPAGRGAFAYMAHVYDDAGTDYLGVTVLPIDDGDILLMQVAAWSDCSIPFTVGGYALAATETQCVVMTEDALGLSIRQYVINDDHDAILTTDRYYNWRLHTAIFNEGYTPLVGLAAQTYDAARSSIVIRAPIPTAGIQLGCRTSQGQYYPHTVLPRPSRTLRGWNWAEMRIIDANPTATSGPGRTAFAVELPGHDGIAHRQAARLGGLHVTGGLVTHWDGVWLCEAGWLEPPHPPSIASSALSGAVAAGSYSYVLTWEYYDALGELHRSGPSLPGTWAPVSTKTGVITATAIEVTHRVKSDVWLVAWRTTDGGTIYYRAAQARCTTPGAAVVFYDNVSNADLESKEALETYLGAQDSWLPEPGSAITQHGNRLWLAHGRRVYYTSEKQAGRTAEWAAAFYVDFPEPIVMLGSHNQALIAISESSVYVVTGDGPDRTGGGSAFSPPAILSGSIGGLVPSWDQRRPSACCSTGYGLVWAGSDGSVWRLPPGSAKPESISSPIEDTLGTVHSIDDQPSENRLHVLTDAEVFTLHYGDNPPVWSRDTMANCPLIPAAGAVQRSNPPRHWLAMASMSYSTSAGVYHQEDDSWGRDPGGSDPALVISTQAMYPGGRGQEYRVREVYLDGQMVQAYGSLSVAIWHDGDSATRYTSSVTTPTTGELAVKVQCARQRCTSIRVRISDNAQQSVRGYELAGLQLIGEPTRGREMRALESGRRR